MSQPHANDDHGTFASIPEALEAIKNGEIVIVMDDEDRENEGDLIMAAEFATAEKMAFFVNYTTGILCAPLSASRASELQLPIMVNNSSDPNGTAFTVTTDSVEAGTGVGATDRALTFVQLADPKYKASQFRKPGHIFPLIARSGGVRERRGHTEASFDLCRLAGVKPVGVIGELVNEDGSMKRLDDCFLFAKQHRLKVITIEQLLAYRIATEEKLESTTSANLVGNGGVELVAQCELPIFLRGRDLGPWTLKCFYSHFDGRHHVALERGDILREPYDPVLLRVHSECFTGDILGSCRCDCGEQLFKSLVMIMTKGRGVLIYNVGHEGRGIGLANKILAYHLQQTHGMDTYAANHKLGFEDDLRNYSTANAIIKSLGINKIHLITSNTTKAAAFGDLVAETVPLEGSANPHNRSYLDAKRKKHSSLKSVSFDSDSTGVTPLSPSFGDDTSPKEILAEDSDSNFQHVLSICKDTSKSIPIKLPQPLHLGRMRVGLVYTSWNEGYVAKFAAGIKQSILDSGVDEKNIFERLVPGSFDIVTVAKALAKVEECDVIICLGVLLKGETMHFENVSNAVIQGMVNVMTETGVPVINGVLNCITENQAKARCGFDSPLRGSLAASALHMGSLKIETDVKVAKMRQEDTRDGPVSLINAQ